MSEYICLHGQVDRASLRERSLNQFLSFLRVLWSWCHNYCGGVRFVSLLMQMTP